MLILNPRELRWIEMKWALCARVREECSSVRMDKSILIVSSWTAAALLPPQLRDPKSSRHITTPSQSRARSCYYRAPHGRWPLSAREISEPPAYGYSTRVKHKMTLVLTSIRAALLPRKSLDCATNPTAMESARSTTALIHRTAATYNEGYKRKRRLSTGDKHVQNTACPRCVY